MIRSAAAPAPRASGLRVASTSCQDSTSAPRRDVRARGEAASGTPQRPPGRRDGCRPTPCDATAPTIAVRRGPVSISSAMNSGPPHGQATSSGAGSIRRMIVARRAPALGSRSTEAPRPRVETGTYLRPTLGARGCCSRVRRSRRGSDGSSSAGHLVRARAISGRALSLNVEPWSDRATIVVPWSRPAAHDTRTCPCATSRGAIAISRASAPPS